MKKYGIIFDLDGTLWNAVAPITDSWNLTAEREQNVSSRITEERMQSMMGKTMDQFTVFFPELEKQKALELLDRCCVEELTYLESHPGTLYPNLERTLKRLSEQYPLYIVSNCQVGYIETFLEACHLHQYFLDMENYGRTGKQKAENIRILMERNDIERGIYIGDTLGDYQAAVQAETIFIHAAYGFGQVPEADYHVDCFQDLPEQIASVICACEKRKKEV